MLSKEEFVLFVGLAWSIWKSRNKALYGNSREDCHQVFIRAVLLLESIKGGLPGQAFACPTIPPQPDVWWTRKAVSLAWGALSEIVKAL